MNLANEKFIHFRRTPTPGLRYVRVTRWTGDTIPHAKSLLDREVLGWTLTSDGRVSRLFSVKTDVAYDGSRDWTPDARYPDSPVDPDSIRIKLPGNPPREQFSTADVEQTEICHRLPFADYWAAWHANEAAVAKARAEQQLRAEREAAEREALRVIVTPRKPPQRSFLSRLFGR